MNKDYTEEIAKFNSSTKSITFSSSEWMKLREAATEKFGKEEGTKKFKEWQRGKVNKV